MKTETGASTAVRRRSGRRRSGLVALTLAVLAGSMLVGCSNVKELEYTPVRMDVQPARDKTKEVSSRLLEMTGVGGKGTVTEPGPRISRCEEYGDDLFSTIHPWSIYGLSAEDAEHGWANLRRELNRNGWKILKDGKAPSKNQQPEIYAENKNEQFDVNVQMVDRESGKMLLFDMVSACFRAASPEALEGEY